MSMHVLLYLLIFYTMKISLHGSLWHILHDELTFINVHYTVLNIKTVQRKNNLVQQFHRKAGDYLNNYVYIQLTV